MPTSSVARRRSKFSRSRRHSRGRRSDDCMNAHALIPRLYRQAASAVPARRSQSRDSQRRRIPYRGASTPYDIGSEWRRILPTARSPLSPCSRSARYMHSVVRETSFRAFSLLAGCNDYGTQEMRPLAYDFRFAIAEPGNSIVPRSSISENERDPSPRER